MGSLPDETQVYWFLKETPNSLLQGIHIEVNLKLIKEGALNLDTFLIDSKPIMATTKKNNFKNPKRNSYDKSKKPKRNPGAILSYYSYQQLPGKKDFMLLWGYRTHIIFSKEGIPIIERTLPNNKTDAQVAKILIKKLKHLFPF